MVQAVDESRYTGSSSVLSASRSARDDLQQNASGGNLGCF